MRSTCFLKRALLYFVALACTSTFSYSQVVPNGSFENGSIPTIEGEIANLLCTGWFRVPNNTTTADYFRDDTQTMCEVNTPLNKFGVQAPADGDAYAGIIAFRGTFNAITGEYDDANWAEYLAARLNVPSAGTYKVSFKASHAEYESYLVEKGLGAIILNSDQYTQLQQYFNTDDNSIIDLSQLSSLPIPFPQVAAMQFVTDQSGWHTISGYVNIPNTIGYYYIVIGAFKQLQKSQLVNIATNCMNTSVRPGNSDAYYFIDDVKMEGVSMPECDCELTPENVRLVYQPYDGPCCWRVHIDVPAEQQGLCGIYSVKATLLNGSNNQLSIHPSSTISGFVGDVANNTWRSLTDKPLPVGTNQTVGHFCISNGQIDMPFTVQIDLMNAAGEVVCTFVKSVICGKDNN